MKRIATGVFAAAAAVMIALPAQAQYPYSIDITVTPPTYSGCNEASVADGALSCDGLNPNGQNFGGNPNFAWVIVGGVPPEVGGVGGIAGLQFGVDYEAGVSIGAWALCTGGAEIPQQQPRAWPESGSGNAMTWPGGCYPLADNPDGLTRVGWFTVNGGSDGMLDIVEDPRIARAVATDCEAELIRVCKQLLGSADLNTVSGGTMGEVACGGLCPVPVRETSWGAIKANYN